MKYNISKIIVILLLIVFLGCDKSISEKYTYKVFGSISYTINTKKISYHADIKAVFLHFELNIDNNHDDDVFLDIGKIQAKFNNEASRGTYYDSIASVIPENEILKKNRTIYNLYFVFSEDLKVHDINEFKIKNFGITSRSR